MEKLDEKSAAKFISALIKSVQALCHGYLDFHNGIEIIGHINLSVDKESSLHYILEEKVCKSEENSTMFISNSFYAQKAELEAKEKSSENITLGNDTVVRTDTIDIDEGSKRSPVISRVSPLSSSHEKTQPSTSSASEADLASCKNGTTPARRKMSTNLDSIKSKTKAIDFSVSPGGFVTQSPQRPANVSDHEDAKPLIRESQHESFPGESSLQHGKSRDLVSDLGVSLVGSVLEPVSEPISSDLGREDDSDGDMEVKFIKKEFLDEERSSCLPENSCRYQHSRGTQQRASSSSAMPDTSLFPASHPHSTAASSTYVPSAHSLDISTSPLYGPSTSSSHRHQGTSFGAGSGAQKEVLDQLGHSSHVGLMVERASYTPPLAHHAHPSVAHPSLGLSVLDLSIKTEPRDPDFLLFDCEQRRKKNSVLFHPCSGPRSEESRQKAKERSKEYRLKQKIHRMTDSTYDMFFRHQVAERKRRQRMRERIKKVKHHSVAGYGIAK